MTARVLTSPLKPQMPARPAKPPEDDKCSLLRAFISLNIDKIIKLRFRLGNVHDSTLAFLFFSFCQTSRVCLTWGLGLSQAIRRNTVFPVPLSLCCSHQASTGRLILALRGGGRWSRRWMVVRGAGGRSLLLGHRGHICLRLISSDFCA